jgi:sarcosine oxidase subunit alpha
MTIGPHRLRAGGRIRRDRPVPFEWEGRALTGFEGDTLASALLAAGVRIVGRSFKYHRPRGIYGAGVEEPNAIVDLSCGARHDPNARATLVELAAGMSARAVNGWPSVEHDLYSLLDPLHRFLPAGFYYKTFMAPHWRYYEPMIRRLAGLGRARETPDPLAYENRNAHCDILVVGGGAAGLAAARAAAASGLDVMLCDDRSHWGGSLLWEEGEIDGMRALDWVAATVAVLGQAGNVRLLARATAFGYYDHNLVGILERRPAAAGWAEERVWQVRAQSVILATGAIERPLVFPDNDRPGVMSASAVLQYLRRYGVLAGRNAVIATNNDSAYDTALALKSAGAAVTVADLRVEAGPRARQAQDRSIRVRTGVAVLGTFGRRGVQSVAVGPVNVASVREVSERVEADLVAISGGWSPAVHLFSQSGGRLRYDAARAAFLPDKGRQAQHLAGALVGETGLRACLEGGHRAGTETARALGHEVRIATPKAPGPELEPPNSPIFQLRTTGRRQWIDFQNDVTFDDIALAARENYVSVEHLKRYTTLGMATDQGKTSNVNGLSVLAAETARTIPEVGTTTFRPPYVPISMGAIAGLRHGELYQPKRTLPVHAEHLALGAEVREYGGWMRAAYYPKAGESFEAARTREVRAVREAVGLFDGSSLGKIEVFGPDAAVFLNLMYYNDVGSLKPSRIRYCLMLRENGVVLDDGVVARVAPDRYQLSPSSSHTAAVLTSLELWHQAEYPTMRVGFHDVTSAWATFAVSGPKARAVLSRLETDIDLSDAALPHMSFALGRIGGVPARIARVSFTGERSYEVSVPTGYAISLWRILLELGADEGIVSYGVESLSLLRAEKGYILIGVDTDGTTMPMDIGVLGPLSVKRVDFAGRRSLLTEDAKRSDRRQLVGLNAADHATALPVGAHVIERKAGKMRSLGYVTSSFLSPTLGRPVALGQIEAGRKLAEASATVEVFSAGMSASAVVTSPCFYDPEGTRLRA